MPKRSERVEAVVLVGGRSRRMGFGKAKLPVGNVPLWRRQVSVLERAQFRPIRLVLRPRQHTFGWVGGELRDLRADCGPLSGLVAALSQCQTPWLAVLAVDLGAAQPGLFELLQRHCRAGVGAVLQGEQGVEPLAAIYPIEALPPARARLDRGALALRPLVAALVRTGHLTTVRLPAHLAGQLANWNSPADLPRQVAR